MSSVATTSATTSGATTKAHSVVESSSRGKWLAGLLVIAYALITLIPLVWILATSLKSPPDSISYPPKVVFEPSLEGYVNLFTTRSRQTDEYIESLGPAETWYDEIVRKRNMVIVGPSRFLDRYMNSIVIGFGSTFLAVFLGTLAAYGFSRFKVPLKDDLLFFILSTRMMPPIAVAIPIYLMYRTLGLSDTALGMILLYTAVNVSLAVWLLKGFIDEIPREYEEAAVVDGYTRLQAFWKVVLPQARAGIAATAIFCLIFAWNEYAFALLLTSGNAQTAPPFIPIIIGEGGLDWPAVAAGTTLFLLPIVFFTVLLRNQLAAGHHLRGGAQMKQAKQQSGTSQGLARFFKPRFFKRGPWENFATVLIALGIFMLMQPFSIELFGYSFAVILTGTVGFVIVSHFPE